MATSKKTPTKKTTAVAASKSTKKPVAKKAPAKAVATKKVSASKKTSVNKTPTVKSFQVAANHPSFKTFTITRQTLYWIIIVSLIIFFQLWILRLQIEVSTLIEIQRSALEESI